MNTTILTMLALALLAGCQTSPQSEAKKPKANDRPPCDIRAYEAGFCNATDVYDP